MIKVLSLYICLGVNLIDHIRVLQESNSLLLFLGHRREPLSRPRSQGKLPLSDPYRAYDHGLRVYFLHVLEEVLLGSTHRRNSSPNNPRSVPRRRARVRTLSWPLPWRSTVQDWIRAQWRSTRFQRIHKSWVVHGCHLAFVLGCRDTLL